MNLAANAVPGTKLRLTRAAFFTFATTLGAVGVLASGCGGDDSDSSDKYYGSVDSGYGGSYPDDADLGASDSAYGLPDAFDGSDDDVAIIDDAGDSGDGGD